MWLPLLVTVIWTIQSALCVEWNDFKGSSYYVKYGGEKLNFKRAERDCKKNGGHLASIHSKEENQFIIDLAKKLFPPDIEGSMDDDLIRFGIQLEGGQWKNIDGTTFDYHIWGEKQPNNHENKEHCAAIVGPNRLFFDTEESEWDDITCDWSLLAHVCKKSGTSSSKKRRALKNTIMPYISEQEESELSNIIDAKANSLNFSHTVVIREDVPQDLETSTVMISVLLSAALFFGILGFVAVFCFYRYRAQKVNKIKRSAPDLAPYKPARSSPLVYTQMVITENGKRPEPVVFEVPEPELTNLIHGQAMG